MAQSLIRVLADLKEKECLKLVEDRLSGLLTLAFDSLKETIEAIKAAGLGDKVKIMMGGGQIDEEVRKHTGADAYGKDPMEAVPLAKGWLGGE
jgi:methanogenic corrinoid protein MtbC1